jgi:tetratricopeptide (TPR) repeat protein
MNGIRGKLKLALIATCIAALVWIVVLADWMWFQQLSGNLPRLIVSLHHVVFWSAAPIALAWVVWSLWPERKSSLAVAAVASVAYVVCWQAAIIFLDFFNLAAARVYLAEAGLGGLFLIGLCWVVWWVEIASQFYEAQRAKRYETQQGDISLWKSTKRTEEQSLPEEGVVWNPLDPQCWLYGTQGKKLNQSVAALVSYSLLFFAAFMASTMVGGCSEVYELPAGGGQEQMVAQVVKVQKVIRKKFVVNPFSAILFEVPPIEEIKLQLQEISKHAYSVGQGEGSGAGFAGGTRTGSVRFIRLKYDGGDWNQDFGKGADENLLIEYGIRTKQKVAKRTEFREISALKNFDLGKSPPLVYFTGSQNVSISTAEAKILREYLIDKHGMIFGDNGGGRHFHNQFLAMMRMVFPNIRPVAIPLDDPIHSRPYQIPFLPYVVPHGGKEALGWKVDGRWVCYYHPGDIGDAWADGHAGVEPQIFEACFQLGTNVIFYAHAEYSKWLQAQQLKDEPMLKHNGTTDGNARPGHWEDLFGKATWLTAARATGMLVWLLVASAFVAPLSAAELDRMDLERWKKLSETERYQLNIAEKYYNDKEWKIAAAEYEKFLTLYERSEGAGFTQLKWSICQLNLRQAHTAIKEGFQAVVDYWPDGPDAVIAAYYIGKTWKDMGELKKAKKAYLTVVSEHPDHLVAAYSLVDLIDITTVEEDGPGRVALWKKLTYDFKRHPGEMNNICVNASRDLATYYFYVGAFDEAVKSIATSYAPKDIPGQIIERGASAIQQLTGDEKSKEKGEKIADQAIGYILKQVPADLSVEAVKNVAKQYYYYTADLQSYSRRYENVPKVYEQMIAKFGVDDGILGRLAEWYKGQNRYEDARITYGKFADKFEGQNQIAYSFRQQQKTDLAADAYRRLALQDSERAIRWTTELANTYREVNRFKEAIEVFTELLSLDSANAAAWQYRIGDAHQHAGQYKEAIASYRECTNFPENYIRMAQCHRAMKQWSEAIIMYNQVMGSSQGHAPWATIQIAYTLEQAGQTEKAIKTFQTVCDKYTNDGHASEAHNHLKNKYKITATKAGATAE